VCPPHPPQTRPLRGSWPCLEKERALWQPPKAAGGLQICIDRTKKYKGEKQQPANMHWSSSSNHSTSPPRKLATVLLLFFIFCFFAADSLL